MMRMNGVWGACMAGVLLCWHTAPAVGAVGAAADTDAVVVPRPHSRTSALRPAPRVANPGLVGADGAEDPEARPLTHYRKPGPKAAVEEDSGSVAMSVAGKLALVLALILACAAAWKRFQGGLPVIGTASNQPVRVTSTVPLGPQRFLHLISIGSRQLLLASTPQSICLIGALDENASLIGVPGLTSLPSESWAASPDNDGALDEERISLDGSSPEERFEELLLRLQDLEAGPAAERLTPRAGTGASRSDESWGRRRRAPERSIDRDNDASEYERWSEPSRATPRARAGDEEEARFVGPTAGAVAGALAPGALFRSSTRGSRSDGNA